MNLPSRVSAPRHVVFYFDFLDPYAYLAATRIPRACKEVEAVLTLEAVNSLAFTEDSPGGPRASLEGYLWPDVERAAERLGVRFRVPRSYPFDASQLLETCLFVRDRSGQEAMAAVAESLWSAIWVDGADPEDVSTAVEAGKGVAVPERALCAGLADSRMPEILARVSARAAKRGVCGVPAVSVEGRLFQGLDPVLAAEGLIRGAGEGRSAGPGTRGGDVGSDDEDGADPSVPDWTFSG